jgi:hypothetical protein
VNDEASSANSTLGGLIMRLSRRKRRIAAAAPAGVLEVDGASPDPAGRGSGDNPIRTRTADQLGRARFADHLTAFLAEESAVEGLVVALTGPWGEGKTSVLNMVSERLENEHARTVLSFNPWMFSGRDQLVRVFFEQAAAQLRLKGHAGQELAARLLSYGQALAPLTFVPLVGAWFGRAATMASAIDKLRGNATAAPSVEHQRTEIEAALGQLSEPLFVFIDDIDRLTSGEIRDMLSLVRLTAHFPKVIYLLAFDRMRVERALDEQDAGSGRGYLDKIVELSFDLPAVPVTSRVGMLAGRLSTVSGIEAIPFDSSRWGEVLSGILLPLLATPRDVNRFLTMLPATLRMTGEEVTLVDVLALEAVRLRLPEVFTLLGSMSVPLTDLRMLSSRDQGRKAELERFIAAGGEHSVVVFSLCRLLFPASARYLGSDATTYSSSQLPIWRKERRVAHPEVLDFYLHKQLQAGAISAAGMDLIVKSMSDRSALEALLRDWPSDDIEDLLGRLEGYVADVPSQAVLSACTVLLNLDPRLRAERRGMLDLGPEFTLDRLVLKLLGTVADTGDRTRIVEDLCSHVGPLLARLRLLRSVGRRPNPETDRLIPADESDRLYRQVCQQVRHVPATRLATERHPLVLLEWALEEERGDRAHIETLLDDDEPARMLLRDAIGELRSEDVGRGTVETSPVMQWELLRSVLGADARITEISDRVAARFPDDAQAMTAVELARRYLKGERPADGLGRSRDFVIRDVTSQPGMFFSPTHGDWPALLIRAAATYETDPAWLARADISGADYHRRLAGWLADRFPAGRIAELASARSLPADVSAWEPDVNAYQTGRSAVQRLVIGPQDRPSAVVRCGVLLPGRGELMRLILDIALSPTPQTDQEWGQLALEEVRDLLVTAAEGTVGPAGEEIIRSLFAGDMPPRTTIELYLWSGEGGGGERQSSTLPDTIDLGRLGPSTRPNQPPRHGMFAVAGDTPVMTDRDRRNLIAFALVRMALDWGYLDAKSQLAALGS